MSGVRTRTTVRAVIALAAFLVSLLYARRVLGTTFRTYDDEGYFLLSLDHYLRGGALYTDVFSHYGPFHFFAQEALFRLLRLPVNHDAGRLVTLIWWLLSAVLGGYFVYSLSNNMALASAATLACAKLASLLANEPGHPQQVILPILMLACCASVPRGRERSRQLLLGALGAALFFTKINIGIFYFAALAQVLISSFPCGRLRNTGVGLLLAYTVGAPVLLMRQDLAGPARGHCELAVLCGASVFLASSLTMPACAQSLRRALYAAAGAVSTALLVVLGTILRGTSPGALIDGVLRAPLRASGLFSIFGGISPRTIPSALLVSACIGALYLFRARGWISPDWVNALRCVVGLWAIAMLTVGSPGLYWVLPFLPLGLMPVQRGAWQSSDHIPRGFVTCLAATQFLQTYPVAGSQLAIAAAPVLLWAFICVHDGAGGLFGLARRATEAFGDRISQESALGGLVAIALVMAMLHSRDWLRGYPYPPSHLRGSASLHIRTELEDRYLFLAGSIGANCDFLFTLPGMGSLNFWSGVPTPNGSNTTAWMRTFSPGRQQRILDTLQASPRGCVVYSPSLASFWGPAVEELDGIPLARYIIRDMPIAAEKDGYEIRVHPHRDSPWLAPASQPSP